MPPFTGGNPLRSFPRLFLPQNLDKAGLFRSSALAIQIIGKGAAGGLRALVITDWPGASKKT